MSGGLVVVVDGDEQEVKNEAVVAYDDEGEEDKQGKGLAELHGHGGGGDGGHDGHGVCCGYATRCTTVVPPAPSEASRGRIHGAPSPAPRHRVPEPVLLPAGRHDGEAMRRCSTMRAQPQERRGGRCPACFWCLLCAWSLHWLV